MRSRLLPALVAGSAAIIINTLALKAADLVPLATAKGGLLRLLASWFGPLLGRIGIVSAWTQVGLPGIASPVFQTGFHLAVGLLMALFYAYLVEPLLPMRDVFKGASYALAVWLLNAFAVLPATGGRHRRDRAPDARRHCLVRGRAQPLLRASGAVLRSVKAACTAQSIRAVEQRAMRGGDLTRRSCGGRRPYALFHVFVRPCESAILWDG